MNKWGSNHLVKYSQNRNIVQIVTEYNRGMKPLPAPHVPGKTEFERFDNAMRQVLSVSKEELLKREEQYKKTRGRKKRARKP
jgi:hypothetical protein